MKKPRTEYPAPIPRNRQFEIVVSGTPAEFAEFTVHGTKVGGAPVTRADLRGMPMPTGKEPR